MSASKQNRTDVIARRLPSQEEYLIALRSLKSKIAAPEDPSVDCGICLESFADVSSTCLDSSTCLHQAIVALSPCKHLFHYGCIARWHKSLRPERSTCPNCRRELFIADPISEEQLQELSNALRLPSREEMFPHLHQNEILLPWDIAALHRFTNDRVDIMIELVQASRLQRRLLGYSWIIFCELIREAFLARGNPLRPVFQPHEPRFLCVVVAVMVLHHITQQPQATRTPSFRRFIAWIDLLIDGIGDEFQALYSDFRRNGLFVEDSYCVTQVTDVYIRCQIQAAARIRFVSTEMESEPWWKESLRRIRHFSVSDLQAPRRNHRTDKTLSEVMRRISSGGILHCLSHNPGVTGVGVFGLDWDSLLTVRTNSDAHAASVADD